MRFWISITVVALLGLPCAALAGDGQTLHYHGIRPSDPAGRYGLRNPERGFRLEARIAEGRDQAWLDQTRQFQQDGVTLAQTYCYLREFVGQQIPPHKLDEIQASFDALRKQGLKAVLRFAYESRSSDESGPTLADIRRHINQLHPLLVRNVGLIHVLQAGMIGLWGEWHHSVHGLDRDVAAQQAVIAELLKALPAERMIQVRRASYKRAVLGAAATVGQETAHDGSPASRLGFHHDYFVVRRHGWDTSPGTQDFEQVSRESPFVMVDGEMPWGSDTQGGGLVDGMGAILRLRIHHYSSFSIAHNFREAGQEHSLAQWMKTPLTVADAQAAKLPVSDGYFEDSRGGAASRTVFEYVRDHLGYRLELQEAELPRSMKADAPLRARITLINRGFSTLHNFRPVLLVLIAANGRVIELPTTARVQDWQPYRPGDIDFRPLVHTVHFGGRPDRSSLNIGQYRIGLWLPDGSAQLRYDAHYAIRCANRDVPWWNDHAGKYGVNILTEVDVQPSS